VPNDDAIGKTSTDRKHCLLLSKLYGR